MTFLGTMTSTWNVVSVQHLLQILIMASKLGNIPLVHAAFILTSIGEQLAMARA
jgi:hypothetical protein